MGYAYLAYQACLSSASLPDVGGLDIMYVAPRCVKYSMHRPKEDLQFGQNTSRPITPHL